MITPRYIPSLEEIRLYKDNGLYWPISMKHLSIEELENLIRFFAENEAPEVRYG